MKKYPTITVSAGKVTTTKVPSWSVKLATSPTNGSYVYNPFWMLSVILSRFYFVTMVTPMNSRVYRYFRRIFRSIAEPFRINHYMRKGYGSSVFDVVCGWRNDDSDSYGGHYSDYLIIKTSKKMSWNEFTELLHDEIDTYCTHSYDCCGHWYNSFYSSKSSHLFGRYYKIYISSSQNV